MHKADVGKFLTIGGSVIAGVIILAIIGYFIAQGQGLVDVADDKMATETKAMEEMDYTKYDFSEVRGADIISEIKKRKDEDGDLIIQVTTNLGGTDQYVSSGTVDANYNVTSALTALTTYRADLQDLLDSTATDYIDPNATFDGFVGRDANDTIRLLAFVQQ